MTQKLGREPSNLEISLFLDIDETLVEEAILATDEVDSFDDKYEFISSYEDTSTRADILDLKIFMTLSIQIQFTVSITH